MSDNLLEAAKDHDEPDRCHDCGRFVGPVREHCGAPDHINCSGVCPEGKGCGRNGPDDRKVKAQLAEEQGVAL